MLLEEYAEESVPYEQDYETKQAIYQHQSERLDKATEKYNNNTNDVNWSSSSKVITETLENDERLKNAQTSKKKMQDDIEALVVQIKTLRKEEAQIDSTIDSNSKKLLERQHHADNL